MKVDGFVALQGGRRQLLVQTILHFKVKLHFYILAPLAPCYFCQVFSANYLSIRAQTRVAGWQTFGERKKYLQFFHQARIW